MFARPRKLAVIGLGRFGAGLARALASTDAEVIAIDRQSRFVESLRDDVTLAVKLDSTDEAALKAQGVHQVDVAIVGIGENFEAAALTVAILKGFGVKRIIARAENEIQAQILTRVGADEIASPEGESALRWAHRLMLPSLKQYIELGETHSMVYMAAPKAFHHKTLLELDLRNQFGVNLIAMERSTAVEAKAGDVTDADLDAVDSVAADIVIPKASTAILPNDVLVLVGSNDSLSALPKD